MGKLVIEHLYKEYEKDKIVIRDINLRIDDGEFFVLLGPSGCGKTTLLNIIAGIESATSGKVYIDDQDCTIIPPQKRNIAVVFQNYSLYPNMTVYKNIAFPLKIQKLSRPIIEKKVQHVADLLKIHEILHSSVEKISGGQKQRVAIARAIVRKPKILLLDEPLSNLDANLKVEIRNELVELHKNLRPTIIYVTHDQAEALTLATKLAIIRNGGIEQVGSVQDLFYRPQNEYIGTFLGIPTMQLFTHISSYEGSKLLFLDYSINISDSSQVIVDIGVRASDLILGDEGDILIEIKEKEFNGSYFCYRCFTMYLFLHTEEQKTVLWILKICLVNAGLSLLFLLKDAEHTTTGECSTIISEPE